MLCTKRRSVRHEITNPAHIRALIPLLNRSPYFQLLNMKVLELKTGSAKVAVQLDAKHWNPFGGVHGGVYASLLEYGGLLGGVL